jgi:hypothetical protein
MTPVSMSRDIRKKNDPKLKKTSKILHLKRENMLFCWAKI